MRLQLGRNERLLRSYLGDSDITDIFEKEKSFIIRTKEAC